VRAGAYGDGWTGSTADDVIGLSARVLVQSGIRASRLADALALHRLDMLRYRASIAPARFLTRPIRPTHALSTHPRRMASTQTIAVLDASELQDGQMCAPPAPPLSR
jgi:hypothetical protein